MQKTFRKNNMKAGFTLIELLITIVIFVIITGVVIVNQNQFNSSELLNNFAFDMALTVRQAQFYGVNGQESSLGTFTTPYGVYFDVSKPAGSNVNFVLFNDVNNDKIYNGSLSTCPTENTECIQRYSIKNNLFISDICAGDDAEHCDSVSQLSILFQRPSLNANIYVNNENGTNDRKNYAKITLSALSGATSSVVVTEVGQIYVKD